MKHRSFNYVRTYRQRYALTDGELALLINQRSGSAISHIELGDRVPTLEGALALQIVFGLAPREMFPGFFEAVEDGVMARAKRLYESLESNSDRRSQAKRDLLDEIPGRSRQHNADAP
jgi:DNA-binding XRE family transcriptional regulator